MMVVFLGPSLPLEEARRELDAIYLPPVAQGDVYRIALRRPRAIGIIDGYFQQVRSVWHKEILWAMRQGVPVYGAASMGALRAAELADFGMHGVGRVFEEYYAERLEDDDEVAVIHGPADSGYRSLSEALVNIRSTLERAENAGIIDASERKVLIQAARDLFYPDRTFARMLDAAPLPAARKPPLQDWLTAHRVDQKADDARALLRRMRDDATRDPAPPPSFHFEHTNLFERTVRETGVASSTLDGTMLPTERLVEELRLRGVPYLGVGDRALLRESVSHAARNVGLTADTFEVVRCASRFRDAHGLVEPDEFAQWLVANDLSVDAFNALMHEEALLRWQRKVFPDSGLLRQLQLENDYADLRERAEEKDRVLRRRGLENPTARDVGLETEALFDWYFERLRRARPADIAEYARTFGFADEAVFIRAVAREYAFLNAPS